MKKTLDIKKLILLNMPYLFSLLCYASYSTHIIRYGQPKGKDTAKKKKRRKVRRRNAVPPSANGVSIPVMKVWRVG